MTKAKAKEKATPKAKAKAAPTIAWTTEDGVALRKMRESFGLSQGEVAGAVGCTGARVCELEHASAGGRPTAPSDSLGKRVAEFFSTKAAAASKAKATKAEVPKAKAEASAPRKRARSAKAKK